MTFFDKKIAICKIFDLKILSNTKNYIYNINIVKNLYINALSLQKVHITTNLFFYYHIFTLYFLLYFLQIHNILYKQ